MIEKEIYLFQNKIKTIGEEIKIDNKEIGPEIVIDIEKMIEILIIIIIDNETIIIKMIEI